MEKLKIYITGADIHVTVLGKLTSGTVGATASFSFSQEWGDLLKTAVFVNGSVSKDVILTGSTAEIPPECLARRGSLQVGVYGHLEDGTIVIPTVMGGGVEISTGTKPSGDTQSGFTPEKWAQMLGMIGDISHLTTEDRSTLVAAVNEIAGYKGMELDDDQINEVVEYYFTQHPPKIGEMTMTGDLDMGGHRVKNVAAPEADGDAVNLGYVDENFHPNTWMPSAEDVGAAPAGYGLGKEHCIRVDSWDYATKNGWYVSSGNSPSGNGSDWHGCVIAYGGTITQIVERTYYSSDPTIAVRKKYGGVWGAWELLNPAMVPGVEYRTTKRHNGNVVYAKCVNLGVLPNAGNAQPYLGYGIRRVISLDLMAVNAAGKSQTFEALSIAWNLYWHTSSDDLSLLITTTSDRSSRTGYAIMEYTKT